MSNFPYFIGIAGPARSGKNTIAGLLLNKLKGAEVHAFADPIKEMLESINVKCSDELKATPTYLGPTPRTLMQTLGTEWGRNINNNFWLKVFIERIKDKNLIIVPDVRFDNEAELIRLHGMLIHCQGRGGISGNHISESGVTIKPEDIIIQNTGTIEDLNRQLANLKLFP